MIFLCDSSAKIVASIPESLRQGSAGVDRIVLIAPFPDTTVVSAAFTLPNGIKLYPQYVPPASAGEYPYYMATVETFKNKNLTIDGITVNAWELTLDGAITQAAGTVTVTFLLTVANGKTAATSASFNVTWSSGYLSPTVNESDLDTILGYLNAAENAANRAVDAAYNAYLITTEDELLNLPNISARRITIDGVTLTADRTLTVNANTENIKIENYDGAGYSLQLVGSPYCSIEGSKNATGGIIGLSSFYGVKGFTNPNVVLELYSCNYVSNNVLVSANTCQFIDNCFVNAATPSFRSCRFICGISLSGGSAGAVEFNGCSYISNVLCVGTYLNCTYVDAETCKGFIPAADIGKVQTLTADGSYNAIEVATPKDIDKVNDALPNSLRIAYNAASYAFKVQLFTNDGTVIDSNVIDLPLEEMVVDATLSEDGTKLILTLRNGNSVEVDISSILSGIATEDYVETYAVPKITKGLQVYATTSRGAQSSLSFTTSPTPSELAQRTANGQLTAPNQVTVPPADDELVSKRFVDTKIEALVGDFDTALDNAIALCDHYINGGA